MAKREEKGVGFISPHGRRRHRRTGTLAPTLLMHMWHVWHMWYLWHTERVCQVALQEDLIIGAVSGPGRSSLLPDNLCTNGGFGRGSRGPRKLVVGG